jgi:hypothetical protein
MPIHRKDIFFNQFNQLLFSDCIPYQQKMKQCALSIKQKVELMKYKTNKKTINRIDQYSSQHMLQTFETPREIFFLRVITTFAVFSIL